MFTPTLLAVAVRAVNWSPTIALVMIICNVLALGIAKYAIQKPNEGPPTPSPTFFGDLSLGSVAAAWCLGHVMGAGWILGLTTMGVL